MDDDNVMRIFWVIFCVVWLGFVTTAQATSPSNSYNWQEDGERLTFDVRWSFMTLGSAELLLENNPDGYVLTGRAWTDPKVNSLYILRDRIRSEGTHSDAPFLTSRFHAQLNENNYRADKLVLFDHVKKQTTYINKHKNRPPQIHEAEAGARDILSVLYALRAQTDKLKKGDVLTRPVTHYDNRYTYKMRVLGYEKMDTIFGEVDVIKIHPVLIKHDNPNRKKERLKLWVTADGRYIPVKIDIKLPLGSFEAVLRQAGPASSPSVVPKAIPLTGKIDMRVKRSINEDVYEN